MSRFRFKVKSLYYSFLIHLPWNKKEQHLNLPSFSQSASAERIDDLFKNPSISDPKWKESGATSEKEYLQWRYSGCGMVSFQMIWKYISGKKVPFVQLGKACMKYGGYKFDEKAFKENNYHKSLEGMYYKGFLDFIKAEYRLEGWMNLEFSAEEVIYQLSRSNFVMASVTSDIRWYPEKVKPRGGHLIAIRGYNLKKKLIYFNDPAGIYNVSQENVSMPISAFKTYFHNRGIIIFNPK